MKTTFKSIIRGFGRAPLVNIINLIGLSISLTLVIILSVYCYSQLTTDQYHENGGQVYLYVQAKNRSFGLFTPAVLKDNIDEKIPGITASLRIGETWDPPVFKAENSLPETSNMIFADNNFFNFFTYKAVEGDLNRALDRPMSIVITRKLAGRLFGNEHALGKTIKYNDEQEFTVSAVIKEPVGNSCLSFEALTNIASRKIVQPNGDEMTNWGTGNFQTFVMLDKGIDPGLTGKKIAGLFPKWHIELKKVEQGMIPLKDLFFYQYLDSSISYIKTAHKNKLVILLLVTSLVLLVAMVNSINILSSQWMKKIKQTGMQKIIGAGRFYIFRGMVFESILLLIFSLLIAYTLAYFVNPYINSQTGITVKKQLIASPVFILISIAFTCIIGFIASFLPALRITSSRSLDNLNKALASKGGKTSRHGVLVVFQFSVAIVLIAFTFLVQKQVKFGYSDFGIDQENKIAIKITPELDKKKDVLKQQLLEKPQVQDLSFSQFYPGKPISDWGSNIKLGGKKQDVKFFTFSADKAFFGMMDLQLAMGRFYDDRASDKNKLVVNEKFINQYGLAQPIGETVRGREIIGVVKDFHYKSVKEPIAPLAIRNDGYGSYCVVNVHSPDFNAFRQTFEDIKSITALLSPSFPVDVTFFDDAVEKMYQSELQFRRAFTIFSFCAIVICCLGILAIAIFACQRKIKEIGIRKVNGAKISEVLRMLNTDFVKWVIISFIVACPIAYYVMNKWLDNFAYKTTLSWWIFALAGLLALGIALLTVSWQSWRAASRNPVEALRYE